MILYEEELSPIEGSMRLGTFYSCVCFRILVRLSEKLSCKAKVFSHDFSQEFQRGVPK